MTKYRGTVLELLVCTRVYEGKVELVRKQQRSGQTRSKSLPEKDGLRSATSSVELSGQSLVYSSAIFPKPACSPYFQFPSPSSVLAALLKSSPLAQLFPYFLCLLHLNDNIQRFSRTGVPPKYPATPDISTDYVT